MLVPFPVSKSIVFSFAEFTSRVLGLWFLARFMDAFGLDAGGVFRTALPLIVLASAVGNVGLPTALTRWLSADGQPRRLRPDQLLTLALVTVAAAVLSCGMLFGLLAASFIPALGDGPVEALLHVSLPLLLVLCVSGSLRGLLIGCGRNAPAAIAQAVTALVQVVLVNPVCVRLIGRLGWSGGQAGVAIMTVAEAAGAGLMLLVFGWQLFADVDRRPLYGLWREAIRQIRQMRLLARLMTPPTLQTVLENLGYGIELPLAEYILTQQFGADSAERWLAEYAAVALPLLHFPMFASDGLATALLPSLTAARAQYGKAALRHSLAQVVKFVFFLGLPACVILFAFAPTFTRWMDAPPAYILLQWMSPLAVVLFIQSPLFSLLQAQGHSRVLLWSEGIGDACRLGALWLAMHALHLGVWGLVLAFAVGTLSQTMVLWIAAWRLTPVAVPWQTPVYAILTAVQMCAVLLMGHHLTGRFGFTEAPELWLVASALVGAVFVLLSGQVPADLLRSLPVLGPALARLAGWESRRSPEANER
ncbi:MAG: polysaccharide biosynthesis C-terminal domain-containing protein [Alicyclobacillus sp.]|nr:polysaccharide biosynthesis C-terminal domain-containing protein [Alicyclobacillus sp.]